MITDIGYSVVMRSRGQVVPCAVCTWHVETRSASFLVEAQNQGRRFVSGLVSKSLGRFLIGLAPKPMATVCEWFGLKTTRTVFTGLSSKPVVTVSSSFVSKPVATVSNGLASKPAAMIFTGFASKSVATIFSSLASKLVTTVSLGLASKLVAGFLVETQNQDGEGFSGFGLKIGSFDLVIWVSKSPRWFLGLSLKTKWASVYRLRHKTDRGRSVRETRRDLAPCFALKQVWLVFPSLA
jgi:hypothetical protein